MKENYQGLPWHSRKTISHQYPLTDAEKLELASQMAEARIELSRLEDKLATIKKAFKEKIDMEAGKLSGYAQKFSSGLADPVEVECDVYQDFQNGEMVFVPVDDNHELKRRPMQEKEKLPSLFQAPEEDGGKIRKFRQG